MRATADFQGFFKRQNAPVTIALLFGIVGIAVLLFLVRLRADAFVVTEGYLTKPWSLITYPFASGLGGGGFGVISLLFLGYWLYWVGTSLELDLGSARFAILWLVGTVLSAIFIAVGATLLRINLFDLSGPLMPMSVLTVVWGIRYRTAPVRLMMILPITGYWMAWLTVAVVMVQFGEQSLPLGIIACLPLAIAWAFPLNKLPGIAYGKPAAAPYRPSKAQRQKEEKYFEDVRKREQERDERERLRKLFEGSMRDDEK